MKNIFKLKTVQSKFLIWIIPTISFLMIALAIIIYQQQKKQQLQTIHDYSMQIVEARSNEIEKMLETLITELQQIARRNIVKTMDWEKMDSEITTITEKRRDIYGFIALIRPDGYYYSSHFFEGISEKSLKDKDYFKAVYEKDADYFISNPYFSVTTGEPIFVINVPVKNKNGELIGSLAGVVFLSTLSKIVENINIGNAGYGWLMDNTGLVFAHPNEDIRMQLNILESSEVGYKNLDVLGEKMLKTGKGTGIIKTPDNIEHYLVFNKVKASYNWVLGITIPTAVMFEGLQKLVLNLLVIFIVTLTLTTLIIWLLTKKIISQPLKKLINFTDFISKGHLYKSVNIQSNDEVGIMSNSLQNMAQKLKEITLKIRMGADNIASGSQQLTGSTSQIAEGANQQAASAEQVSSSIEEMTATIEQNTQNAQHTEKTATQAAHDIQEVKESVDITIKAIKEIAEKISIISDIAERTDLLAINAAVEAARAGENGKGFAVVASEVRKLAENSQRSAVSINELSLSTVEIAVKSGELLSKVVPIIQNNNDLVREISASSTEQNSGVQQINEAIQQLSQVTQENSAASEQMAASSEELAKQADLLKEAVLFFKATQSDASKNVTNTTYQKLLEAISFLKENDKDLSGKTLEIDLENFQIKNKVKDKTQPKVEIEKNGINLSLEDNIDDQYEKL